MDIPTAEPGIDFDVSFEEPYEFTKLKRSTGEVRAPRAFRGRILVHTVHDGGAIPKQFRFKPDGTPLVDPELLEKGFVLQRDWGANHVAHLLAAELGLARYGRVRLARILMDFNRFPGSTPPSTLALQDLHAISYPYSDVLSYHQKAELLEGYYDRISDILEAEALPGKLLCIAVHTYDEHNPSLTRRPEVSLITRPAAYQQESRMPFGVFDPLFPDRLGESTCSRILRDRISLNLERNGFRVSQNHPYPLPNGSLEVRALVWYFFQYLRDRFESAHPDTREDPAFEIVWSMLLNTNLRSAEAEALRGFLHRFRRVGRGQRARFDKARRAYEQIESFVYDKDIIRAYRRWPKRPSCFGIEVRKDLVCHIDPDTGLPRKRTAQNEENARRIARLIAEAIHIYFTTDREYEVNRPSRYSRPPSNPGLLDTPTIPLAPPSTRGH
ncbi:MAG: N-formylglutamate amidohydrolase [Deltaproteobacteria bacterium]|jgi:hypothetical protein|nr:N-formylglutamate amidohydrolase [Deltaproteobacteria bacterium]MBW2530524.1 N-formylglutamate amidohydrolase [Deltaproteobacteria bacterium]